MQWDWLAKPQQTIYTWGFGLRVMVKAAVLFAILNVIFAILYPIEALGRLSLYNVILPGRERLPYGENPTLWQNVSLYNIPAMFASHEISRPKADDEYRVLLMGDSATWGWLLTNENTLAGQLNALDAQSADGRRLEFYNLGYPIMSLTKDLMLLDYAMQYKPDMVVWLITLESFPRDKQVFPPIVQNNAGRVRELIKTHNLNLDPNDRRFVQPDFVGKTIVGSRRVLADWLRLQLYGFAWASTGIDIYIPDKYELRASDFEDDLSWQSFAEPQPLTTDELAFDVLRAGVERADSVPILIVNEPMFISGGENSDLRYNFFYPRWAYDAYHTLLLRTANASGWTLVDAWDALPPDEFTDSPVHTTPEGARQFAALLLPEILRLTADSL